ncbi:MAG: proline dehydrogenase family protein, partial [Betaproteobacteria bacterium]
MAESIREPALDALVFEIGSGLYQLAAGAPPSLFDGRGLKGRVVARALEDELLRAALFRFIDTLPQLETASDVATHFFAYFAGHPLGGTWGRLLKIANPALLAPAVRIAVGRVARYFLVEESQREIGRVLKRLQHFPAGASFDAVGEAVLTDAEAEHYLQRNLQLLDWQVRGGANPPHFSIKLSALTAQADPIDIDGARGRILKRLERLMPRVLATSASLTIDMEQVELKPLILDVFQHLIDAYPDEGWLPGIALQAYLPETHADLEQLIAFAHARKRRIGIRLVKGAYWDTEVALARQRRWPQPVFAEKSQTDAQFERLTGIVFDHADVVYPAIASHNIRSLAHAMAAARLRGLPSSSWEVQTLYGMADPLVRALAGSGVSLRVYVPVGDLLSGIAYLIRRLMENTANTSIVRQTYAEGRDARVLLAPPRPTAVVATHAETNAFANTALLDFSRSDVRSHFKLALDSVRDQRGREYSLAIHGAKPAGAFEPAINPADPDDVLGRVEMATPAHAEQAVANALEAFAGWRETPAAQRLGLCLRAAGIMLRRREELAAWQVFEVGKNWREADADVAEAIDYLRYYAQEMARLDGWQPTALFPGETNHLCYEPRGVAVVIAPWNFPLAILTGMTAAALVSGNTAIMKPAGPARLIALQLLDVLREAGVPARVCQLLPGRGDQVGQRLVEHPDVALIAFTGSREAGLSILGRAAGLAPGQQQLKRVVCEMGGKNAIIVDADADLDEAVLQTLHSAFGYQGQKCSAASRVIVVGEGLHNRFTARLAEALDAYRNGPPQDPQYEF